MDEILVVEKTEHVLNPLRDDIFILNYSITIDELTIYKITKLLVRG
jgi:hypothetical protein